MRQVAILLLLAASCATRPATPPAAPPAAEPPALTREIQRIEGLIAQQPTNTPFMYVLATYYDRAKDPSNVVRWLTRLDELGWNLGLAPDSFLETIANPAVERIAAKLEAREERVNRATVAFTFPKEHRSEGIAYDPVGDRFYFSGGKDNLLRVDRNGSIEDFPIEPVGEKFARLGMDVDVDRRQIWVVSSAFDPTAGPDEKGRSAISVYDLTDGRLLRRVMHGSATEPTLLNDLSLLPDGSAFVTDSHRHQVVSLRPDATAFEVFAGEFRGPNGISTAANGGTLYVADFRGINRFDIATKSRELLETSTPLNGIDGLIEHNGALIGIQNVLGRPRVVRVHVAEGNRVEVLESKNPLLNVPSTGVVAGREYFFMANRSQKDADKVILRIPL